MGVAVVEWLASRLGDREVRGSNLAAVVFFLWKKLHGKNFVIFTLAVQHRIDVSDFEEHLGHGVGIRLLMLIQTMAVYCEEEGPQVEVEIYSV